MAARQDCGTLCTETAAGRLYHRRDVSPVRILDVLAEEGEVIKRSRKAETVRAGEWVLKGPVASWRSRVRLALQPGKFRRAWQSGLWFEAHNVPAPAPIAYLEPGLFQSPWRCVYISAYVEGAVNVEAHARTLAARGNADAVRAFLARLAEAIQQIERAKAYHSDLSGKNILTRTGHEFWFIDLDAVRVSVALSPRERLLNHVQLYDSFCDLWDGAVLDPFVAALWPGGGCDSAWLEQVRQGQRSRRARIERIWRAAETRNA